jgi:hypothetical protein
MESAMSTNHNHFDAHLFDSLVEQIETAVQTSGGLSNASTWVEKNTRDPVNTHKPWSFKHHEYQRAILDDTSAQVVVRKTTQCGLSELSLRLALAIVSKFSGINVIYVLPTANFASRFAMNRFDPVIQASPKLQAQVSKEVNSNQMKRFGNSHLHIGGANTEGSAISIPARSIIIDELSFCDPKILSIYMSRLGHTASVDRLIRKFSSPLFPHADISLEYEKGDQKSYWIYHDGPTGCSSWIPSDILDLLTVPGFDSHLSELCVADLDSPRVKGGEAYFKCPSCGGVITKENLCDPSRRAWVAKYPSSGREVSSYDAGPLVLPSIRTPQALLSDLRGYGNTQRWMQFSLGVPCESSSDTILGSAIENSFVLQPQSPRANTVSNGLIGTDVGIVSHSSYGVLTDGKLHVLWMETLRQDENNNTFNVLKERFSQYKCIQLVVDSGPDISLVQMLKGNLPFNRAVPAYFVRSNGSKSSIYDFDEDEGVLKVRRNGALDLFVSDFNAGKILLPRGLSCEAEIRAHLPTMKRISTPDGTGEDAVKWVASNPATHFFFSLLYLWLAAKLVQESRRVMLPTGFPSLISKVRLKSAA